MLYLRFFDLLDAQIDKSPFLQALFSAFGLIMFFGFFILVILSPLLLYKQKENYVKRVVHIMNTDIENLQREYDNLYKVLLFKFATLSIDTMTEEEEESLENYLTQIDMLIRKLDAIKWNDTYRRSRKYLTDKKLKPLLEVGQGVSALRQKTEDLQVQLDNLMRNRNEWKRLYVLSPIPLEMNALAKSYPVMTVEEFFERKDMVAHHPIGCYVLYNHTKDMFYVGQSVDILSRVSAHFTGGGNGDVYADHKYNDVFYILLLPLADFNIDSNLDATEKYLIDKFDAYYHGYNKTRGNGEL